MTELGVPDAISEEDLAYWVGLDRTYVSSVERGIRNPTFLVLLRLARVLEVRSARLMDPEDDRPAGWTKRSRAASLGPKPDPGLSS